MRNESSSTLNPQELIGRACSQSPPRGSRDASNRALSEGLVHSSSRTARECATAAESQCLCLPRAEPWGEGEPNNSIHLRIVKDTRGSAEKPWSAKMASLRGRVAAAEARKAEGASITTLRTPSRIADWKVSLFPRKTQDLAVQDRRKTSPEGGIEANQSGVIGTRCGSEHAQYDLAASCRSENEKSVLRGKKRQSAHNTIQTIACGCQSEVHGFAGAQRGAQ